MARKSKTKSKKRALQSWELMEQANAAMLRKEFSQAVRLTREAINMLEKQHGAEHDEVAEALEQCAAFCYVEAKQLKDSRSMRAVRASRFSDAQQSAERALAIRIKLLGTADHAELAVKHHNLGVFYAGNDIWVQARKHYELAAELYKKYGDKDNPSPAHTLNHLGFVYLQVLEFDRAEAALLQALAWLDGISPEKGVSAHDRETVSDQLTRVRQAKAGAAILAQADAAGSEGKAEAHPHADAHGAGDCGCSHSH